MPEVDNPFWDFSLAVYDRAGVAPACLALQERHGIDVNLLLFCCWAGVSGHTMPAGEIGNLIETVEPWRGGAVLPLRALRDWLKDQSVAPKATVARLRERIKEVELQAEAIQQGMLIEAMPFAIGEGTPAVTVANMTAYFSELGIERDTTDTADLATVLRGCYPEIAPLEAVWLLAV